MHSVQVSKLPEVLRLVKPEKVILIVDNHKVYTDLYKYLGKRNISSVSMDDYKTCIANVAHGMEIPLVVVFGKQNIYDAVLESEGIIEYIKLTD